MQMQSGTRRSFQMNGHSDSIRGGGGVYRRPRGVAGAVSQRWTGGNLVVLLCCCELSSELWRKWIKVEVSCALD